MSGALKWTELVQLAMDIGFAPPILVTSVTFTSDNDTVSQLLGAFIVIMQILITGLHAIKTYVYIILCDLLYLVR